MTVSSWRTALFGHALLLVLCLGSCVGLVPVAVKLADPLTHVPVDAIQSPFPILVVTGSIARVVMVPDPRRIPPVATDSTFLVPAGSAPAMEQAIRRDYGSSWVLRVSTVSTIQQRIELFRVGDGYSGGTYSATATTVTPLARKISGPGFGIAVGALSIFLTTLLWGLLVVVFRFLRPRLHPASSFKPR